MDWAKIIPVIVSILVIIFVAIISDYSKTIAAITATMPLTAPLSFWIVYAAEDGNIEKTTEFAFGIVLGIIPTLIFAIAAWQAARNGQKLVPVLIIGYLAWGISLLSLLGLRRWLG